MKETFITSLKLKSAYQVNSILYSLKQIPGIKTILPIDLYSNSGLQAVAIVINLVINFLKLFFGKLFYILVLIFIPIFIGETDKSLTFIHIFTFLTLSGAIINTKMFNPTKDKYYAMMLLNMDAREYTLTDYYFYLLKTFLGFLPFTIIFGLIAGLPFYITLLLPLLVVSSKIIVNSFYIRRYEKKNIIPNENKLSGLGGAIAIILIAIAYLLPILGYIPSIIIYLTILATTIIGGLLSISYLNKSTSYKKIYKILLTEKNIDPKINSTTQLKETALGQIAYDSNLLSNKKGYAYFHDLFVKRHKKILNESADLQTKIIIIIAIISGIVCLVFNEAAEVLNSMLLTILPYFLFLMYYLNRGTTITNAMFMNCDHSMLTFRFYRTPKVILGIFKERLKTMIKVNLKPSLCIAISLPVLLFISGGTDNYLNYPLLFISIIAMSIFFSVHYLVMYYLLQPYNSATEVKSSTYSIVQGATYFVCYTIIDFSLPNIIFGTLLTIFCIIYCIVSLFIAYKYAPKTFKLRQ